MSTLAMSFVAIVAFLNGIILLGSVSPVSAYRSLSFERYMGKDFLLLSPSAVENTTVYYTKCNKPVGDSVSRRRDCALYRVKEDFSGGRPKEDKCDFTIECEFGGRLILEFIKIDPLGRDRAIVRWVEEVGDPERDEHRLRLSIVDFSNCKVTTTNASQDLDRLMEGKKIKRQKPKTDVAGTRNFAFDGETPAKYDYNWPMYQKGDDDFEIVSIVYGTKQFSNNSELKYVEVLTASIDADGVASKVSTLLPRTFSPPTFLIYPLAKDQGYLYIASESPKYRSWGRYCCSTMTVALIQSNGQRRNLTHVQDVYHVGFASVSLANGMIGICVPQNFTSMQCTQFRLDDQEIKWFPVGLYLENLSHLVEVRRLIYNLPRGEGFLTEIANNGEELKKFTDKYLLKIGLDGKVKQSLDPDMYCEPYDTVAAFNKIFEDDRGNYCVTLTCVRYVFGRSLFKPDDKRYDHYVKLQSKCFEPEDFKNVSKYEVMFEYLDGYPREGGPGYDGIIKKKLLIE